MFENLLVPVDFTDRNLHALDVAAQLASRSSGHVTLFHVIQTIPGLPSGEEQKFYAKLEASARKKLRELGTHLEKRGVRWNDGVATGSRVGEILEAAARGIDLLVLSSHRIDPDQGGGWGTLSYQLAVLAQCPVLLVK